MELCRTMFCTMKFVYVLCIKKALSQRYKLKNHLILEYKELLALKETY